MLSSISNRSLRIEYSICSNAPATASRRNRRTPTVAYIAVEPPREMVRTSSTMAG